LDASVALFWLVPQSNPSETHYADAIQSALKNSQTVVRSLIELETANAGAKVEA